MYVCECVLASTVDVDRLAHIFSPLCSNIRFLVWRFGFDIFLVLSSMAADFIQLCSKISLVTGMTNFEALSTLNFTNFRIFCLAQSVSRYFIDDSFYFGCPSEFFHISETFRALISRKLASLASLRKSFLPNSTSATQ